MTSYIPEMQLNKTLRFIKIKYHSKQKERQKKWPTISGPNSCLTVIRTGCK